MGPLLLLSRCLSYSVIAVSVVTKLPQVVSLLSAGSAHGVNVRGCWMETACYLISWSYGYFHAFHYSTYVEAVLLTVQSCAVVLLVVRYSRLWNLENAFFALITFAFVSLSLFKALPAGVLYILLLSTLPLSIASKLVQMRELHRLKQRGDVSLSSWSLATYCCAARLITVAVEVRDTQVFVNYLVAVVLNSVVVLQCLVYSNSSGSSSKLN